MNRKCQSRAEFDNLGARSADSTGLFPMLITRGVSFDQLVGAGEQRWRNFEAERLRGPEIDDQLHLRGLLDRQISRLFAFENSSGVNADLTIVIRLTGSVAQQAAGRGERAILMDRGHRVAERQCGELFASGREECTGADD